MNKKLYYTICSAVIGVFLIVWSCAFVFFTMKTKSKNTPYVQNANEQNISGGEIKNISTKEEDASGVHYLIVCENNVLNVYEIKNGEKNFYEALSINVSQMRKADREEFEKGVTLNSKIELAHIIEDYAS